MSIVLCACNAASIRTSIRVLLLSLTNDFTPTVNTLLPVKEGGDRSLFAPSPLRLLISHGILQAVQASLREKGE